MRLLRLFPRSWRERYGEEFEALLEESELSPRDLIDLLRGAWDARLRPQPHLVMGGRAMSASLIRGLWSLPAAAVGLALLVIVDSLSIRPAVGTRPPVDWVDIGTGALGAGVGLLAAALWRWDRLRPLWVLLALFAARVLQVSLTLLLLNWLTPVATPLHAQIDPLGLGWLPGTWSCSSPAWSSSSPWAACSGCGR